MQLTQTGRFIFMAAPGNARLTVGIDRIEANPYIRSIVKFTADIVTLNETDLFNHDETDGQIEEP